MMEGMGLTMTRKRNLIMAIVDLIIAMTKTKMVVKMTVLTVTMIAMIDIITALRNTMTIPIFINICLQKI